MVITAVTQDSQFLPKGNSKKLKMAPHFSGSGLQKHLEDLSCRQWWPHFSVQSNPWHLTTMASRSDGLLQPVSVSSYFTFYSIMIRRLKTWPGLEGKKAERGVICTRWLKPAVVQTEDLTEEDSMGREECCFQLAPLRALTVTRASRQVISLGNECRDLQLFQGRGTRQRWEQCRDALRGTPAEGVQFAEADGMQLNLSAWGHSAAQLHCSRWSHSHSTHTHTNTHTTSVAKLKANQFLTDHHGVTEARNIPSGSRAGGWPVEDCWHLLSTIGCRSMWSKKWGSQGLQHPRWR